MSLNDPQTNFKVVQGIDPVTLSGTTTEDGASVDTKGFKWATFILYAGTDAGALSGSAAIITSDPLTGGSFATAITGAAFTGATLDGGDAIMAGRIDISKLDYTASRFLRIEVTLAGTTTGIPIAACCILSNSEDDTKYQTVDFDFGV